MKPSLPMDIPDKIEEPANEHVTVSKVEIRTQSVSIDHDPEPRLDTSVLYGARSFFALHVMLGHWFAFFTNTSFDLLGSSSVSLFFILSGFVMTIGYGNRETIDKSKFYFKRFARLMPVFYVMFALHVTVMITLYPSIDVRAIIWRFLLLDVWLSTINFFFGEAWALSVMIGFYLFFPFIVSRFHSRDRPTGASISRFIKLSFFAYIMALAWSIVYGIVAYYLVLNPELIYFAYRMFLPARLLHFSMGIIAASMSIHKESPLCSADATTLSLTLVIILSLVCTSAGVPEIGFIARVLGEYWLTPFQAMWLHALIMQPESRTAKIFQWRIFHVVGNWSYTCYMCHMFVFGAYVYWTGQMDLHDTVLSEEMPWVMEWHHFLFVVACVAGMSWMLYRFVEKPCRTGLVNWYTRE